MTQGALCVNSIQRYRAAIPAIYLYIAIRMLGIAVLVIWSAFNEKSAHVLLSRRWDSLWYSRIADHGYNFSVQAPDGRNLSSMAFFPLLPWLEKLGSNLGLDSPDVGLTVSAVSSLVAAVGIFVLASHVHSAKAGIILVGLWAALPVGIVQSMAYSESLFVALASWALYSLLQNRWITAGILAFFAGLTRPIGMAVCAAVIVSALLIFATSPSVRRDQPKWLHVIAGCVLAPLGAAGYILWVGCQRGKLFGYLDVQSEWGNGFDAGINFGRFLVSPISNSGVAIGLVVLLILGLFSWPHWIALRQKYPISLVIYSFIVTILAVGASGYFGSKPRLLMPAFPILLPLAISLARARSIYAYAVIITAAVGSAIYGAFWLNGSGPP
ncbi:glycosyltransferase family 39 protein [Streptomyces sp. NPDC002994]|uniref:mannosyltransferase family protein n=1 Tax=Streptomyces sp. NPDC002994 TaxID=3154441 RepID=UPI0033B632B7